jgi:hypothetical protein
MGAAPGALEAVLHQVVGAIAVADQGEGIAAQVRDLRGDELVEIVDGALRRGSEPVAA